jgi:hypothetical protein
MWNIDDEELSDIEDLVIDLASGQILYAVTDIGGFLGIGAKSIAIPWSAIAIDAAAGEDDDLDVLRLDVEDEFLENAPVIELDDWVSSVVEGWDEEIRDYWIDLTN